MLLVQEPYFENLRYKSGRFWELGEMLHGKRVEGNLRDNGEVRLAKV